MVATRREVPASDGAAALLGRLEDLHDLVASRAREGEHLRRIPDETMVALADTGVFRALVSPQRGGGGLGLDTVLGIGRTVGRADTATGWVTTFLAMHNWLISMFPAAVVDEVFGTRGYAMAPAALSPSGSAVPVDGGYQLSGRWQWGSGVLHADHVLVTGVVVAEDALDLRMVLLDLDQVVVEDVWHTDGLRATGSNDVVVEDVVVASERTVSFLDMVEGRAEPVPGTPMAGYPLVPVLALTAAAPLVGGAEGAFGAYRERLAERVLAYTLGDRQAERATAQVRLAVADSDIRAARLLAEGCARTLDATYGVGEPMDRRERSALRMDTTSAVHMAKRAVAMLCDAAGGTAHLLDQPLQRFRRDLETGSAHAVFDLDRAAETRGRALLGLEPGPSDML